MQGTAPPSRRPSACNDAGYESACPHRAALVLKAHTSLPDTHTRANVQMRQHRWVRSLSGVFDLCRGLFDAPFNLSRRAPHGSAPCRTGVLPLSWPYAPPHAWALCPTSMSVQGVSHAGYVGNAIARDDEAAKKMPSCSRAEDRLRTGVFMLRAQGVHL